ncbi:MAG: DNA-processing protein DprA [Lachnospiraceae bacterium]|nr:DNA-processing protein DprA [Lachnospiraceae bacterium]
MTEKEYLFLVSHIAGIGAVTIHKMREYFGSFEAVWKAKEQSIQDANLLTPKRLEAFRECKKLEVQYLREYEKLKNDNMNYITCFEEEYPGRLAYFKDRPAGLFVKGELPGDDTPTAAIVGARNCTEYGRQMAEYMGRELSNAGVSIISGLALGVDGAAHKGCLEGGSKTFAVLGCGVNVCYPRENYRLFSKIQEQGGVISEFLPGTAPVSMNFPMRNRIISGLSDVVIIIEAREKSGSLITGDLALEQGKEVYAVPGRVNDPLSAGCNKLLQIGAAICLGPEDVLDFFDLKYKRKLGENKISEKRLAKREKLVYSFLDSRPKSLEEIVTFCQITVSEAMESLMTLELMGMIRSDGNQYYCRKM